jgi:outer membrane protein OmpA-like peptidoglycan-associated protein
MKATKVIVAAGAALLAAGGIALAQTPTPAATAPSAAAAPAAQAPTSLSVYFSYGSWTLAPKDQETLDEASRIFNDGKPIVMIITGMTDATGAPGPNLLLSQKRADVVFQGLIARGLPPEHFQILAAGATASLAGKAPGGADEELRKVEITWR